jgi:hypothetical protein
MTLPGYTAEASLYTKSHHYTSAACSASGMAHPVVAQQLCRHSGQSCGGIDLICCPGLRCTAPIGGHGICVSHGHPLHCSQCFGGEQICCPPPGFGMPCYLRAC